MYKIYFYKDRKGNQPVADYFNLLAAQNNKDSRIKATKIRDYKSFKPIRNTNW